MNNEHPFPFFSKEDFIRYKSIKQKNEVSLLADEEVAHMKLIFQKSNYWAKMSILDDLVIKEDNRWQNSGYVKRYSWPRIYFHGDSHKLVYFTIGLEVSGVLVYKLDCQRSQNMSEHLSPEQVGRFDSLVKDTSAQRNEISSAALKNMNWNQLIAITTSFIRENLDLYHNVIDYVWEVKSNKEIIQSGIIVSLPKVPEAFNEILPAYLRSQNGKEVDYELKHRTSKRLGDLGEQFILQLERNKLKEYSIHHKKVEKQKDGVGYDLGSADEKGNDLFIEVKTTTGKKDTPFHLSDNEYQFLKNNSNAVIYRVFDFKPETLTGKIFKMSFDDLKKYKVTTSEHKIYFK